MAFRMAHPWKHPKSGIYWFRKRVPDALRQRIGKTILQKSLLTRDAKEAELRFHEVALRVEAEWAALRRPPAAVAPKAPGALTRKQE